MTGPWALRREIPARLNGVTPVCLTLAFRLVDPAAIGITLDTPYGPASWCVARELIRDGLCPDSVHLYAYEPAAAVQLTTPPRGVESVLALRGEGGVRWLVTVATDALARFLALTEQGCSIERESEIITAELEAQIGFMHLADPPPQATAAPQHGTREAVMSEWPLRRSITR